MVVAVISGLIPAAGVAVVDTFGCEAAFIAALHTPITSTTPSTTRIQKSGPRFFFVGGGGGGVYCGGDKAAGSLAGSWAGIVLEAVAAATATADTVVVGTVVADMIDVDMVVVAVH